MKVAIALLLVASIIMAKPTDNETEKAAIKQVIQTIFDGMKEHDAEKVRKLFLKDAIMRRATYSRQEPTKPVLIPGRSPDAWLKWIGENKKPVEEKILSYDIQVDDRLATAWTKYEFYVDGKMSHHGYNAFMLHKTEDGWKVFMIVDTSHKPE